MATRQRILVLAISIVLILVFVGLVVLIFAWNPHPQSSSNNHDDPPSVFMFANNCDYNLNGTWVTDDLAAFLGIPYAEAGRFQPASPVTGCWTSPGATLVVDELGPACYQIGGEYPMEPPRIQSEACLNLDVYSSLPTGNPVPVVVWIYGGSLVVGSTTSYTGLEQLAKDGEIVLVAMNYRLAAFGFLAHPALSEHDARGVSGNYGITDIVEALRWVQGNILAFGGDPGSVTVIGQSSGGTAILALLASSSSNGLFHRAISLSASPNMTMALEEGEAQGIDVVRAVCPDDSDVYNCLMDISPMEVANLFPSSFGVAPLLPEAPQGQSYPGLPLIDGTVIEMPIEDALDAALVDVPLLLQVMYAEMDTFEPNQTIYDMDATQYRSFLSSWFTDHGWANGMDAAGELTLLYARDQQTSTELAYQAWISDYSFICGHLDLAVRAGQSFHSPVYLSVVVRPPDNPLYVFDDQPPSLYAGHMWDWISATQGWAFFTNSMGAGVPVYEYTDGDESFGAMLMSQWQQMFQGVSPSGLVPVDDPSDFPLEFAVNVQEEDDNGNMVVQQVSNYKERQCQVLEDEPIGMGKPFWCVN